MKVKPLKNHLLVKLMEEEKATKSGILLAGGSNKETNVAKVVETADCYDENDDIFLKGDKILIDPRSGTKVKTDGEEYLIISQKEILAIVK